MASVQWPLRGGWLWIFVVALTVATATVSTLSVDLDHRRASFEEAVEELGDQDPMKRVKRGILTTSTGREDFVIETELGENETLSDFDARHEAKITEAENHYGAALTWNP